LHEPEGHRVRIDQDLRAFGTQCNERVDVEEPAIVELVVRRLPPREPVVLTVEDGVHAIAVSVDLREHLVDIGAAAARDRPDLVGGIRRQRRDVVVVTRNERILLAPFEMQFAGLEHAAVVVAEHRK
jgi:hypothetical protein